MEDHEKGLENKDPEQKAEGEAGKLKRSMLISVLTRIAWMPVIDEGALSRAFIEGLPKWE